jgi:hypothetical protein
MNPARTRATIAAIVGQRLGDAAVAELVAGWADRGLALVDGGDDPLATTSDADLRRLVKLGRSGGRTGAAARMRLRIIMRGGRPAPARAPVAVDEATLEMARRINARAAA